MVKSDGDHIAGEASEGCADPAQVLDLKKAPLKLLGGNYMAKVGLKDTLALLAKGYSKKEIDALAAIDEENSKQEEQPVDPAEDKV